MEKKPIWQPNKAGRRFFACRFDSASTKGAYLNYLESYPLNQKEKMPLIVYVHGAGSRGQELGQMGHVGPLGEVLAGRELPAIVIAPQCHADTWFELFPTLLEFIDDYRHHADVDIDRVYLCGISMGSYASWQAAMSRPDWFAALVAVCGGGMYWNAARLKTLPIWAFHGALDTVVLPEESIHMVSAVNRAGGNAKITIYPKVEHNSWENAYADDSMWEWLFQQKKTN